MKFKFNVALTSDFVRKVHWKGMTTDHAMNKAEWINTDICIKLPKIFPFPVFYDLSSLAQKGSARDQLLERSKQWRQAFRGCQEKQSAAPCF